FTKLHYKLAKKYLKLQECTRAYKELSRTIELQPDNYQAHIDIANLLIAGHDLKQAQEHTDLLLSKQPNNPQVHESAANLLAGQGNFAAAIQEMRKTIDLGPDRWEAYLNLALLQVRTNQGQPAEKNFQKAADANPKAR